MTDMIEGPIHEIQRWANGKGADVRLHSDSAKYFYYGEMKLPIGQCCVFEIREGEGEQKGKYEILSFKPIEINPEIILPPPPPPPQSNMTSYVKIPYDQFKQVIDMKSQISEARSKALDAAVRIYAGMHKVDTDGLASTREVIRMAVEIEGYLV